MSFMLWAHVFHGSTEEFSDGNHISSLFVCCSCAKVSEFSFAEKTLLKRALGRRGSEFPSLLQLSRLRRRLFTLVRLTVRNLPVVALVRL